MKEILKTSLVVGIIGISLALFDTASAIATTTSIVIMLTLRSLSKLIFPWVADRYNLQNGSDKNRPRDKFMYNCWLYTIHWIQLISLGLYLKYQGQLELALMPWSYYNWDHSFFYGTPEPMTLDSPLLWMYALQAGFYVTEMIALFFDHPPGDFWEALLHHIATMSLILGSIYFERAYFGVFVMIIHELAEPLIVGGKASHYAGHDTLSNFFFISFVLVWIPSRCMTYTYWMYILACAQFRTNAERAFFLTFLYGLQALHWYWTALIFKVAYGILRKGLFNMTITDEMDHSYSGSGQSELAKLKSGMNAGCKQSPLKANRANQLAK
jgi:hypothetical protein